MQRATRNTERDQREPTMHGKTCMITGATSGIGRATAMELARRGATLVLVCRDRRRGEHTVAEIGKTTGHRDVTLMLADLSSQADVRRVAAEFLASERPLHVLINNAGVINLQRTVTVDGIETTFAVNHLAYFLLTNLLLARLQRSAPARIVNVASDAHTFGGLDFDDLGNQRRYRAMRVYGQSKLANILFTAELARRIAGSGVTANSLHPGAVATGLGKNNGAWARALIVLLRPFFRTPVNGAATSIHLAASPAVEGVSGQYFANCREKRPSRAARDADAARRLWDVSAEMTGL
jgi:NAD(P)-dependent dehydrogenase (short-subunit alcohol dehydrogenase family)